MERFTSIFLVAGLLFFVFAFIVMAVIPYLHFVDLPTLKAEDISSTAMPAFQDLEGREPAAFRKAFPGGATPENLAAALREGRAIYAAEGCWHCHSQFVRPVSNEEVRWGKISAPAEYQNELQLPPLLGTRRVGPDLTREAGVHSNDWHMAHFYNPRYVSPTSVMPPFPWFFDEPTEKAPEGGGGEEGQAKPVPNRGGFAIITYVQWLGSWIEEEDRLD